MPYYLTKPGLKSLQEEQKRISEIDLPQTLASINEAREAGDLKENAAYQTALKVKDELNVRLNEIEEILGDFEIIEEGKGSNKTVQIGNTVKVQFIETEKTVQFKIVGTSESDILTNKVSNEAPIARAVIGKNLNEKVTYKSPNGKIEVKILEIN